MLSTDGLDREYVLLRLVRSLLDPERKAAIFKDYPQIYQLYFYSGRSEQQKPDWSTPIYLNRLERHLEQLVETSADLDEIQEGYDWGVVDGITTNPSLLKKAVEKRIHAGEQIDLGINPTQIPPGSLVGEARPIFPFRDSDFWAQGLHFGVEFWF